MHNLTLATIDRNHQAELDARAHRLDLDRVISAALDVLWLDARFNAANGDSAVSQNSYLTGATGVTTTRDVLSLIDEVKRSLSPLVR